MTLKEYYKIKIERKENNQSILKIFWENLDTFLSRKSIKSDFAN